MDDRGTECRGARLSIGKHQPIPELRVQPQGSWVRADLPSLLAVWWRCRNGVVLVRARERADKRPPLRFAPLALIGRQGRPPRCEVDGAARHIAGNASRLELRQGKPPIADERFVVGQLLPDPLEE